MAHVYGDGKVAHIVEEDIENFARIVTDSFFKTHSTAAERIDVGTFAKSYFDVFKRSLQTIEKEIKAIRQKDSENLEPLSDKIY